MVEQQQGVVYTETVIHSAPEAFVNDAPYQMAIVSLASGGRRTGRVRGERLRIGDSVRLAEVDAAGISWFEAAASQRYP
jgi:uncharacterized OB-fold protein